MYHSLKLLLGSMSHNITWKVVTSCQDDNYGDAAFTNSMCAVCSSHIVYLEGVEGVVDDDMGNKLDGRIIPRY